MSECRGCAGTCCTGVGDDPCACPPREEVRVPLAETGQQVIEELRSRGIVVAHEGVGYTAQCPLHGDQMATLMIRQLSGGLLVHCRGGCPAHRVLKELKIGTRASTRRSD